MLYKAIVIFTIFVFLSCQSPGSGTKPSAAQISQHQGFDLPQAEIGQKAVCPVTNNQFEVREDSFFVEIEGKKYYVCCFRCVRQLKEDPEKFLR